jgi:hypothetical protein
MIRYGTLWHEVVKDAAAWGADEQLRLCVEWVANNCPIVDHDNRPEDAMQSAMRPKPPKPPSLKEQAISELSDVVQYAKNCGFRIHTDTVLRALETLP